MSGIQDSITSPSLIDAIHRDSINCAANLTTVLAGMWHANESNVGEVLEALDHLRMAIGAVEKLRKCEHDRIRDFQSRQGSPGFQVSSESLT